ncbi:Calx-beta domain protein [Rubripirellula tenax]|uniref:Calx-beta domain protein n=2 Tax=Rubripirellula tenax TaxID=2528015 RepID=A0A5C6FHE1_9BACT|nr:Calx-beta domain protein [Rubripirellula tenax]
MLAGDAGHAVAAPVVGDSVADDAGSDATDSMTSDDGTIVTNSSTRSLVFVDPSVPNLETLLAGVDPASELVLLTPDAPGVEQITRALAGRKDLQSVHILAHGASGSLQIGNSIVTESTLVQHQQLVREWSRSMAVGADLMLYGCHVGQGEAGTRFVNRLAQLTGADVAASIDATGAAAKSGDWELERVVGSIESSLAITEVGRQDYQATLAITIRAAGVTNEETMVLQVGGATVATFSNVGGDAYAGQFQTYTYDVDGVSAGDVRIAFTNDLYDDVAGIDRNLRIDSITIDGTTFQTESPTVFSTGTWLPADGVVAGFRQSEFLHTDGYFQFAPSTGGDGSLIQIRAAGSTGEESVQLEIDGVVVQSWDNIGTAATNLSYQAAETVTADRVRVSFTNDLYDPDNGIDRNLTVDSINIDGASFQTEAANVYSTGTWLPADGIVAGFRQSETLHTNGYFQYAATPVDPDNPGAISLTLDSLTVDEGLGTLNFVVFREGGADGAVSVNYATNVGTADGNDFQSVSGTLTFADGVTGQQISLQIADDDAVESDESFSLTLSNPTGGATLGSIVTQVVTITDNDEVFAGILFEDSFEGSSNWTTDPDGTDTATTGQWAAGAAQATSSGTTTLQLGQGRTGSRALVTGLAAGSSVGSYDVDSGVTTVVSPDIALPTGAEVQLSFGYYLAYLNNATSDDYFHASVIAGGVETEVYADHAHGANQSAAWTDVMLDLSAWAGQTIQLQFAAADALGASLIEAAVDDVVVEVLPVLPGTITIATTGVNLDEAAGTATVVVQRNNGRVGTVTVDYATNVGTADTADFTPVAGTLTFADGQSEQIVTIPIINDSIVESLESFSLVLSNATGGAVIGSDNTAVITIADNDSTTPDYLPDLTPIASTLLENLSIDRNEIPGRTLLRFSTEVANAGDGPLEIWGGSTSGNSQQVFQRIYQADGGYRDQLAGEFVYHPSHGHIHFEGFATYDLVLTDASGNIVASGGKTSFCLINIRQPLPTVTADAGLVHGRGGNSCGNVQGISTGYSDVYSASLDDQWIDVTNVANGQYWLQITTDPENNIQETDETNNTQRVAVTLRDGQIIG